jgi:hypothetical protein
MLDHPADCVKLSPMSVSLVPLSGRHARDLQLLAADEPVAPWMALPSPHPHGGPLAFIESAQRLRARGTRETFAVCEAGRLLGIVVLARHEGVPDHAEFGYWIGRQYRDRGHATAAAGRLLAHGFERGRLMLVFARCLAANRSSIRVLEKLGFRFAGLERSAHQKAFGEAVRRYEVTREAWRRR